jgi:hypothetical protein
VLTTFPTKKSFLSLDRTLSLFNFSKGEILSETFIVIYRKQSEVKKKRFEPKLIMENSIKSFFLQGNFVFGFDCDKFSIVLSNFV